MKPTGAIVSEVEPESLAQELGIQAGDEIITINRRRLRDYLDYKYQIADPSISLSIKKADGRRQTLRVEKDPDQDLGIRFRSDVFDRVKVCNNKCLFCFMDQMPRGLRKSLFLKDDDYRLSFLHGNYLTLTNLTPADIRRIVQLKLSPLYVSVHTTDPELRRRMLGNPKAPDVLRRMKGMIEKGIVFHAQIVVCPGINDGDHHDGQHLERSVRDLANLYPGVKSLAVVPVGLTKHRARLLKLRPVTRKMAREIIAQAHDWQKQFRHRLGSRFVFLADEFYLLTGDEFPSPREYEDFPQLENGVGMARLFLDEVKRLRLPDKLPDCRVTLVTGVAAQSLVSRLAEKLKQAGIRTQVMAVPNRFFGSQVTVSGLLVGTDLLKSLSGQDLGDLVIVPRNALKDGKIFLDDLTIEDLGQKLGIQVEQASTPKEVVAKIKCLSNRQSP